MITFIDKNITGQAKSWLVRDEENRRRKPAQRIQSCHTYNQCVLGKLDIENKCIHDASGS